MTGIGPVQPGSSKSAVGRHPELRNFRVQPIGASGFEISSNLSAARLYQATTFAVDIRSFMSRVSDLPA